MFTFIRSARQAVMLLGAMAPCAWAEAPPLVFDVSPQQVAIFDIATDGETIFAAGERGVLLSTELEHSDTWNSLRLPKSQSISAIALGEQGQGVVVGHGGVILYTENGGQSWTPVDVADTTRGDPFMDVAYLGNQRFLAVGAFGLVMLSEDGGKSWAPFSISEDYFDRHLYTIAKAGSDWLLIGESGSLFVSSDDGVNWTQLASPYEGSFFGGTQTPDGSWLLYGMRGQLWRSADRGASWQQISVDTQVAFNAHGVGADGQLYVFGNGGQVVVSENGGQQFAPAARTGIPGDITAAVHINDEWLIGSTAGIRVWDGQGE